MNRFIACIPDRILLSDSNFIPRLITNYVTSFEFEQEQDSQSLATTLHTYFGSTPIFDLKMNPSFDSDMSVIKSVNPNLDLDAKPTNISAAANHN